MELKIEIRDHNVRPPIAIDVTGVYSHTGFRIAVPVECNFCLYPGIHKCSVVLVEQQEVGGGVPRHEQIRPAIIIEVNCHNPERSAHKTIQARGAAEVRECTVAIVVVDGQRHSFVGALLAVRSNIEVLAFGSGTLEGKLRIIADDKIEKSIAIVV